MKEDAERIATVSRYHQRTWHRLDRYARSAGYLDWATQPDPFRHYAGCTRIELPFPASPAAPLYDDLYGPLPGPRPVNAETIGELFYHGLAISAWKQVPGGEAWSLRVNPSSGNLHPTEGWLICGPGIPGIAPGVAHYAVDLHALELRLPLEAGAWAQLAGQPFREGFFLALSSVAWREAWKYGERAYRYTQHDVGHAIAALAYSAAMLGWDLAIEPVPESLLESLLGIAGSAGVERERGDCLLRVTPGPARGAVVASGDSARGLRELCEQGVLDDHRGTPNELSPDHQAWPVIDEVAEACRYESRHLLARAPEPRGRGGGSTTPLVDSRARPVVAAELVRQRRSAVAMDGRTPIAAADLGRMLARTAAIDRFPFAALDWPAQLALVLFVHRVDGLEPGIYLQVRNPEHMDELRESLREVFLWEPVAGFEAARLFLLLPTDVREAAQIVSCHQEIAADGAFSLGMLARFRASLAGFGGMMYPRLYWEAGLIGQLLYLEAEAAGVRATGIGCFFDSAVHEMLGIADDRWQSLYHFTVGGALEDTRLRQLPAYHHLPRARVSGGGGV